MKLIISFCNQPGNYKQSNLLILDTETAERHWIDADVENDGVTGVAQDNRNIYALYQSPKNDPSPSGIIIIDKETLTVKTITSLQTLHDPHSCIVDRDGSILAVSTGIEQVLKYQYEEKTGSMNLVDRLWQPYGNLDRLRVFYKTLIQIPSMDKKALREFLWRLRSRNLWDPAYMRHVIGSHHLNSLYHHNGNLFVSAFGPPAGELYRSATDGYIYDIKQDKQEMFLIHHPHSVIVADDDIYYCESCTQTVKKGVTPVVNLPFGYTRGLAIKDDKLIVGSSTGRKRSRSKGTINNVADQGLLEEVCCISIFTFNTSADRYELTDEFDFLPHKKEIYDVIAWE